MSLAAEREAAAARRWETRLERTAAATLRAVGRGATLREAEAYIRETWATLDDGQVEEILARVGTMREEPPRGRRLTPEEIEMAMNAATTRSRDLIRELLRQDPTLTANQLWERAQGKGVELCAKSSFTTIHVSAVRKELGIDPKAAMGRGATEKAKPAKDHPFRKRGEVEVAASKAKQSSARQPSEEVAPTPRAPEPPPAAPVAEALDELRRPIPMGEVRVPVGDWHERTAHAIQAELLRAEQRVRKLKIALEVLEELVA